MLLLCICFHIWMKCNRLQLNSSKSEFIWCSSSRRLKNLDCNTFVIGADAVQPKKEVRDLGLIVDRDINNVVYHGTCEDQLRNPKTAEVCFSVSYAGWDSPSSAKFEPEPNRLGLLHYRLCRLATKQHHSAPGGNQRYCLFGTASQKVRPHLNP